jgi:hypothetical protein
MMAVEAARLKAVVTADTSDGERKIRGFVEKQANVIESGFSGIGKAMGLAATAMVVQRVAAFGMEAAKLATQNAAVETSFRDLAAGVGQSSDEILDSLRATSDGTISDYDLMLSANRAMMLGVADTAEEMSSLLDIARRRGQAMGLTTQQAFNDIVTGLGRGSALILDNLGIVIDLEEAYESYAAQMGKTANQLTDVEKKQAMVNRVMRETMNTGAEIVASPFERMDTALSNLKVSMGELFSPAVTAAAEALVQVFDAAKNTIEAGQAAFGEPTVIEAQTDAVAELNNALEVYQNTLQGAPAGTVGQINQWLEEGRAIETTVGEMQIYYQLLLNVVEAEKALDRANKDTEVSFLSAAGLGLEETAVSMISYVEAIAAATDQLAKEARQAAVVSAMEIDALVNDMAMSGAENLFGDIGAGAFDHLHELRAVAISTYNEWIAKTHDAEIAQFMARDAVSSLVNELGNANGGFDAATQAMVDNANNIARIVDSVSAQLFDVIGADAFDSAYEYERILSEVYSQYIEDGYTAEQATIAAQDAAAGLVDEITQLHGNTLDEVADAAFRAEQQLWGTAAAAQAVLALVDQSRGAVNSMYLGAVGSGLYSGSEGAALASQVNAEREALIRDMAELGVPLDEATFRLAEFDAGISATIDAERQHQNELRRTTTATRRAGDSAQRASDGLRDLESALGKIPGLFGTTEVTDEDLALGDGYQNKADEYLRRLRDEVQNGKDWEGVDIGDAAAALGLDPAMAAEEILNAFQAAWEDSSLFANPENMKFIDMEAVQRSLERQQDAAQGEKNLKALFGIGNDADVAAVAALGLEVQSGLAGWLTENGMEDAGARLAEALAVGLKTDDMGEATASGLQSYVASGDGQEAFYAIGYEAGGATAQGIRDRIMDDLNANAGATGGEQLPPALPPSGSGGASAYGMGAQGVVVNQQIVTRSPIEADIAARKTAEYIHRRQRR